MLSVKTIEIPLKLFQKIINHAIKSKPYESVSILSGSIEGDTAFTEAVYTPKNIENSTVSFSVDPITLLEIYTTIEENGRQIIAIYHTHPAPPKPSGMDLSYMEVNPYIWLISSIKSPDKPKGYLLLEDKSLRSVEIRISKEEY